MEQRIDMNDHESIGALFRKVRLDRSLEISDIAQETKITPDIIRAMEADDFSVLPALAFARGFYGLYAQMLGLNQDDIVERFVAEYRRSGVPTTKGGLVPPRWQEGNVGNMASPPSHSLGALIGIALLCILLLTIGVSWYIGYNPASQASKWLRSFQQNPVEQPSPPLPEEPAAPPIDTLQSPATGNESSILPAVPPASAPPLVDGFKYQLVVEFQNDTSISISIDEAAPETTVSAGGTIKTWQARDSIAVELPRDAAVRLFLNGIMLPLPQPTDAGTISLTLPEYLLD